MIVVWILSYIAVFLLGVLVPVIFTAWFGLEVLTGFNAYELERKEKNRSRNRPRSYEDRYDVVPDSKKQESTSES